MSNNRERGGESIRLTNRTAKALREQAKQQRTALYAAATVITLVLAAVVLLILPYLLFDTASYIAALVCMLAIVVLIIAGFTYYTSVAQDKPFRPRFLEMAGISCGVAVISFFVGILAKQLLGVEI